MEAKLKQLKIVDLKDILTRAQVTIPNRANKPDLIALITASPEALDVYEELHGGGSVRPSGANTPGPTGDDGEAKQVPEALPTDASDILAPPEPFDWSAGTETSAEATTKPVTASTTTTSTKPPPSAKTAAPAPATPSTSASATQKSEEAKKEQLTAEEDEDLKKRRARAERFGIPLITNPPKSQDKKQTKPAARKADISAPAAPAKANGTTAKAKTEKIAAPVVAEDPEKLKARAMRFGLVEKTKHVKPSPEGAAAVTGLKRAAPTEPADSDDGERRRKRAERFGLPVKT